MIEGSFWTKSEYRPFFDYIKDWSSTYQSTHDTSTYKFSGIDYPDSL